MRQKHGLGLLVQVSALPRSTYYYCCKNSKMPDKYRETKQRVEAIFHAHKGRYGYRRVACVLCSA